MGWRPTSPRPLAPVFHSVHLSVLDYNRCPRVYCRCFLTFLWSIRTTKRSGLGHVPLNCKLYLSPTSHYTPSKQKHHFSQPRLCTFIASAFKVNKSITRVSLRNRLAQSESPMQFARSHIRFYIATSLLPIVFVGQHVASLYIHPIYKTQCRMYVLP